MGGLRWVVTLRDEPLGSIMNGILKKILIFAGVLSVLAVSGWGGRKVYRKATERRLLAEARLCLEKHDTRNASLCLQRALQVNPTSVEVSKLTADMLEAGGSPAALNWRIRTSQLQTNNMEFRMAWAETAMKLGDSGSAAQAIGGLDERVRSTVAFHKLAGALAWSLNLAKEAEEHYAAAGKLEPSNDAIRMNLATIRLSSTNEIVATGARVSLEQVSTNSPLRTTALRYLVTDADAHKAYGRSDAFSRELVASVAASYVDRIARLQVLHLKQSSEYRPYRAALEQEAAGSSEHACALGRWMAVAEGPTNALRWLQTLPLSVQTNLPVPLIATECQMALKDWKGLLSNVAKRDWGDSNFYRCALESLALRGQDQGVAAKSAWQKAFRLASQRLDRLAKLSQLAAAWGWKPESLEVLQEVVSRFPKEKWAVEQLIATFYVEGNSRGLADLLAKMHSADPSDNRLKNNLASIYLLRKSNLLEAHRMAREAYDSSTDNPFFASTYAYSLLLQNKVQEAVRAFENVKEDYYLKIPSIAVYYGVVQAGAGRAEIAREPLKLAEKAKLLPEEKELVRLAMARM